VSEETIITEVVPTTVKIEPTSPSQPHADATPTPARTTEPPPGWDANLLKAIEGHYARYVGPVAKVVVRRTARRTLDIDELYTLLAENLGSVEDRKGFLATRAQLQGALPKKPSPGTRTAHEPGSTHASRISAPLTPEAIDAAQSRLAAYVGPIAKVIVKKAAAQAKTSRQFYMLLADHLGTAAERQKFLDEVGVV
jgi:serine/threonine-protein kinase